MRRLRQLAPDEKYPPHHPKSESFIDFILPKVLYGLCALGVSVALALLRHPTIARLDERDWLVGKMEVRLYLLYRLYCKYVVIFRGDIIIMT